MCIVSMVLSFVHFEAYYFMRKKEEVYIDNNPKLLSFTQVMKLPVGTSFSIGGKSFVRREAYFEQIDLAKRGK